MSKAQGAQHMQVSERSLRRLIEEGRIPVYKPVPGRTLVKVADLDAFMESTRAARESQA